MTSDEQNQTTTLVTPGIVIGGFRVQAEIGRGGMSTVYLAIDDKLERRVALKLMHIASSDYESRVRFLREAKALARIDDPHVVRVLSFGEDGAFVFLALEYIDGDPLASLIGNEPLDDETALLIAAQIARGLAAIHEQGVVHRDVKPANVLIDDEGQVHIVDFGIAQLSDNSDGFHTKANVAIGTPHYMAPEQAGGEPATTATDVWGLGATLFTMVVGKPPYYRNDDDADLAIIKRIVKGPAPRVREKKANAPVRVDAVVGALMQQDAHARPSDLRLFAVKLESLAGELSAEKDPMDPSDHKPHVENEKHDDRPSPTGLHTWIVPTAFAVLGLTAVTLFAVRPRAGHDEIRDAETSQVDSTGLRNALLASSVQMGSPSTGNEIFNQHRKSGETIEDKVPILVDEVIEPERNPSLETENNAEINTTDANLDDDGTAGHTDWIDAVSLDTPRAVEIVRAAATGAVAIEVVRAIERAGARWHFDTVRTVLFNGPPDAQSAAIHCLLQLRMAESVEMLNAFAAEHPNSGIGDEARAASQKLFSVD